MKDAEVKANYTSNEEVKSLIITETKKAGARAYEAAKLTRFNTGFTMADASINRDLRNDRAAVNGRARTLWQNSSQIRRYRNAVRANIVGPEGFSFQATVKLDNGEDDIDANKKIEAALEEWSEPEYCTVHGMMSFLMVQWQVAEYLKREGEYLVHKITGNINKFGYALEMMEPDWIEQNLNVVLDNGNVVIMGVEVNKYRRPVAIWFKDYAPRNELFGFFPHTSFSNLKRIPVEELLFGFDPEYANQQRGISPLAQAMLTIRDLDGYRTAAIINARAGAAKMGFIKQTIEGDEYNSDGQTVTDDGEVKDYDEFEPGIIGKLQPGEDFIPFDPSYPKEQYGPFVKEAKREIAGSLGMAYEAYANDRENVNFGSLRGGTVEERDLYKCDQSIIRDLFLKPNHKAFIQNALLFGAINLPYANKEKYQKGIWSGRGYQWIDPRADMDAAERAIRNGLSTRAKEAAKLGADYYENIDSLAKEEEYAKNKNVKLGVIKDESPTGSTENPASGKDSSENDSDDKGNTKPGRGQQGTPVFSIK
jgi:lambda family phage portal protein